MLKGAKSVASVQERFEQVKEQLKEQETTKIQIQTQLSTLKKGIDQKTEELKELGIEFDTMEELEQLVQEKEQRVESLLQNMEDQLN